MRLPIVTPAVLRNVRRMDSPFAGFEDFEACVIHQTGKGHSEESAKKICGALQAEAEGGDSKPKLDGTEPLKGVIRSDYVELEPATRTAEGYLRFHGFVARPGVMLYSDGAGGWTRVLVEEETLHDKAALDTLKLKPLTVEHPDPFLHPDQVTPENERDLAVGSTGETVQVHADGRIKFSAVIRTRQGLDAVAEMQAAGKTLGLSPGYVCDEFCVPGVHPKHGAYDRVQRNRRYNHLAITDSPRGGPSVHFRIDSGAETMNKALLAAMIALGIDPTEAAKMDTDDKALAAIEKARQAHADALAAKEKAHADALAVKEKAHADALAAAKPKAPTAAEAETARLARVKVRKDRKGLEEIASHYKIDATEHDDDGLRTEILKAAKVAVPKIDGMKDGDVERVAFEAFRSSFTAQRDAKTDNSDDPMRAAFRFDSSARADSESPVDPASVYADRKRTDSKGKE